ncbi:LysR family transcriptional regulator [Marinobacter sp.]|uniref:LysR family transcriptional regulator n=1 Tax=Marinobacter sp. TaxID=50741 RepID=UPI002B48CA37|nr:LysR family transcriptional regulator [Marinobacter sp.]HKK57232.1 LysR family transcriptional regulator [Marinobacter sp.]
MNPVDAFNLDTRSLATFLAVLDEGSVSRAAVRMGVSQSAVSHTLDRLRLALGDDLFVKSGRSIVATRYAVQAGPHIRQILDELKSLPSGPPFTPATAEFSFTIAANDYQRDLLLPGLASIFREQAPGIRLQVIPSGIPSADMLRKDVCDLIVSPHAPATTDIMQRGLMTDHMAVYYDPTCRRAPETLADYLTADHIGILFGTGEKTALEDALAARGLNRRTAVTVANFSGLPAFLRGTDMLATAPGKMRDQLLKGFSSTPLPFDYKPFTLLMLWHKRHQSDPAHRWIRNQLNSVAAGLNR